MMARCSSSAKVLAAAWTQTFANTGTTTAACRPAVTARLFRHRSISTTAVGRSTVSIDASASPQASQSPARVRADEGGPSKHERTRRNSVFLNPEDIVRVFAPGDKLHQFSEANTLEDTLADVAACAPPRLAALVSDPVQLRSDLQTYLRHSSLTEAEWVAMRNAMLCKSWSDVRRYMAITDDSSWPLYVLRRAVSAVATPSEASDALALLALNIQRVRDHTSDLRMQALPFLSSSFSTISSFCFRRDGSSLHLIPRLADVLTALIADFPIEQKNHRSFILEFVRRSFRTKDERARNAIIRILDSLQGDSLERGASHKKMADVRNEVVHTLVKRIEIALARNQGKTASSELLVNTELMDLLTEHYVPQHSPLEKRALLSAIIVAGRNRDYRRVRHNFDRLEQCKHELDDPMAARDYLELAKALVRTEQGIQDALDALHQAEKLLAKEYEDADPDALPDHARNNLAHACLDMLQVMVRSPEVRLDRALSLLGIIVRNHAADTNLDSGEADPLMSQGFRRLRGDVYSYTVVMQGCLMRGRPDLACTVWQAMLNRNVFPSTACLSVLLQNLFQQQEVAEALRQLALWTEIGIPQQACRPATWQEIELETIETPAFTLPFSQPSASPSSAADGRDKFKLVPDPILASVVLSGLHSCGAAGTESLWNAYQQTMRLFPDAPVLALFLKASCGTEAAASQGARFARQVFRSMLFGKHPELSEFRTPLHAELEAQGAAGWILSHDTVGSKMEQWFSSAFGSTESDVSVSPDDLGGLMFTSKLFEHYLRLLLALQHLPGHVSDARLARQELIDVLAWMRELGLKPSQSHVALTVLEIEERLPPPIAARHMEVLDAWLADWLGKAELPDEALVRRAWRWKMQRNGQLHGWFDRIPGPWEDEEALSEDHLHDTF